jgi:hypothetical protein
MFFLHIYVIKVSDFITNFVITKINSNINHILKISNTGRMHCFYFKIKDERTYIREIHKQFISLIKVLFSSIIISIIQ